MEYLKDQDKQDIFDHSHKLDTIFEALDKEGTLQDHPQEIYELLFQDNVDDIAITSADNTFLLSILIYLHKSVSKQSRQLYHSLLLEYSTDMFKKFKLQVNEDNDTNVV